MDRREVAVGRKVGDRWQEIGNLRWDGQWWARSGRAGDRLGEDRSASVDNRRGEVGWPGDGRLATGQEEDGWRRAGMAGDRDTRMRVLRSSNLGHLRPPTRDRLKKRRAANIGHFQPDVGPDQFLRIVFKPTFNRLRIPHDFVRWFGEIPSNIIVTTNTGCYWRMTTVVEGDDAYIDRGWAAFTVAHRLQIGQFLVFKKVSTFQYNVVIFDYTCTEVMTMCRYHGDTTRCVVFQGHV
ncbi:hypothetical protein QYE76_061423 [Lolium multiflorum]|uniref:TF-B3 domain-containing protein n=1 Tax=Lolium multiflorum TaxID=4521 RepID=A0AAD8S2A4_LOLMU|nr:hypothetical protein QYE76_061423 [Lolium multiflorum]